MSHSTDPARVALGTYVRNRRLDLGLTQEELAERAGLGQETISSIERGTGSFPRLKTLSRLARGLGDDLNVLLEILEVQRVITPRPPPMPVENSNRDEPARTASDPDVDALRWTIEQLQDTFGALDRDDAVAVAHLILHLMGRKHR